VSDFVEVDVEPGPASEDGLTMRWKRAPGGDERAPADLPYESEAGLAGRWRAHAADDAEAEALRPARAYLVEDSSDGTAWLVVGGPHGLLLEHIGTGTRVREPYLVLSKTAM
jgi:hypothetical protein